MRRPALLALLAAALAASGCASLRAWANEGAPPPPPDVSLPHPASAASRDYEAGMTALVRGDADEARRDLSRCLDEAPAGSPDALHCLVALENVARASSTVPDGNK
ncbi:MAG: hypothetical protein KGM24_02030 [Elusimicrobia bacterium]|nr:hypothetical protein [Elusimicrobiota bacterium]